MEEGGQSVDQKAVEDLQHIRGAHNVGEEMHKYIVEILVTQCVESIEDGIGLWHGAGEYPPKSV